MKEYQDELALEMQVHNSDQTWLGYSSDRWDPLVTLPFCLLTHIPINQLQNTWRQELVITILRQ